MNLVNELIYKLVNDLAYWFIGVLFEIPRFARNDGRFSEGGEVAAATHGQ